MPKKQTQRGCALSKRRRKQHNKSVKQRGGNLHKMYSINNLAQDPQRMIAVDHGIQRGGKKHGHSRKYFKHGGSALGALNTVIDQISTRFMPQVDNVSKTQSTLV